MKFDPLIPARFLERLNRFVCLVDLKGKEEKALIRNTGRLSELLQRGKRVYLREKASGKYGFELLLVEHPKTLVCVNSHLPPKLLVEYLSKSGYPWELKSYRFEFPLGGSRFDLLINDRVLIETKSVNLVVDGKALFPDAPTIRGKRHVEELMNLADSFEPAVIFVVQREDAESFGPNWKTDPEFSESLKEFGRKGYRIHAFGCRVTLEEIYIERELPVEI